MALINGMYIHVTDEEVDDENEVSSHPVETGIDITDTVKNSPVVLSISGKIVDYFDGSTWIKAHEVLSKLKQMKKAGTLITYEGRNICYNMQIKKLTTSHPNTNTGGADFDMELYECRIAENSYKAPTQTDSTINDGGKQQVEEGDNKAVYYTTKKGDTIWGLVVKSNAPYKNLSRPGADFTPAGQCQWVIIKNPTAFSRKGDATTLQIGKKILVGYKR